MNVSRDEPEVLDKAKEVFKASSKPEQKASRKESHQLQFQGGYLLKETDTGCNDSNSGKFDEVEETALPLSLATSDSQGTAEQLFESDQLLASKTKNPESSLEVDLEEEFPEGGFGWLVIAASFSVKFLVALGLNFGLFFLPLLEQFEESRTETALVGSLCIGCIFIVGPISSFLCNLFGHRATCMLGSLLCCVGFLISAFSPSITVLYFSYGILVGLGLNTFYVTSSVMPSFYFKKRRQIATGISVAGTGFGLLILPVLLQYCIDLYTWRGAMLIAAGVVLHGCIAGALFRPRYELRAHTSLVHLPGREEIRNLYRLFTDLRFLLLNAIQLIFCGNLSIYFTFFPDRVLLYGVPADQAAILLSIGGVCSAVSRLVVGALVNFIKVDYNIVFGSMCVVFSVPALLMISDALTFGLLVPVMVIFGFCFGIGTVVEPLRVVHMFGIDQMTSAFGCLLFFSGFGHVVGPPFTAFLRELTGSYKVPFLVPGIATLFNALLHIPLYLLCKRRVGIKGRTK